jgi:cation diffusion facilitator CzcD-associated flavoprotein CzcO
MTYHLLQKGSPMHEGTQEFCRNLMLQRMKGDPELAKRMIPDFAAGCRRISPGDGYLEALQEKNVTACWDAIECITEKGIKTAAGEEEFDMIVCATGFDTTWVPQFKLSGRSGTMLDDAWKNGDPEAFLGINVEGMPNYFMLYGPNSPVGNGSVLRACGWACDWIMRTVNKVAEEDIK